VIWKKMVFQVKEIKTTFAELKYNYPDSFFIEPTSRKF